MNVVSPRQGHRFPEDCARKFRAEKLIASGGYGAVLLATQLELERPVVVKLLLGSLADADAKRRFDDEARMVASLSDPHIVRVLDHGSETVPWIAFELVDGGSLRARLAAGRLAAHEVAQVGAQVCHALETAHAARILHRDVKPDNILQVSPELWKLTDFGVARWDEASRVPTQNGLVLGTPAYLAPEVVRGDAPDERQDLYALGATLYELATGRPPFVDESAYRVLEMQISAEPLPPTALVADLPRELEAVILQALAKDRSDRFASAAAMAAALTKVGQARRPAPRSRGGQTIQVAPAAPPPAPPVPRAAAVAGAFALGAVLTLAAVFVARRAPDPVPVATAAPDPAAALIAELRALDVAKVDGPALDDLLGRLAALPVVPVRIALPEAVTRALSDRVLATTQLLEADLAAMIDAEREREPLIVIPGHEVKKRSENRALILQRLAAANSPLHDRMKRRYVERARTRVELLRAAFALDLDLPEGESIAGQLGWEYVMAGLFDAGQDAQGALKRAEEGRAPAWGAEWIRAHLAARAGDETLACRYAGRAMRLARETARVGDPEPTLQRVGLMIRALHDFAPGRGEPYHDALAEARLLVPAGFSLPPEIEDRFHAPRPRR